MTKFEPNETNEIGFSQNSVAVISRHGQEELTQRVVVHFHRFFLKVSKGLIFNDAMQNRFYGRNSTELTLT